MPRRPVHRASSLRPRGLNAVAICMALVVAAGAAGSQTVATPVTELAVSAPVLAEPAPQPSPDFSSTATTPLDYRRDAAEHLYRTYPTRIYKGRLPPLIASVAVFEVHIDSLGEFVTSRWVRAPWHRPDIMADIERIAKQAAPYPAPIHMPGVVYTDVWLYDKSGLFQLATLTEGQRGK